jgi:hypothetical protein
MHALPVTDVWVHLAPDKEDVEHHVLGGGLAEVDIVWHASLNVLEDFGAEGFVGAESYPRGLSKSLVLVNVWSTLVGELEVSKYLVIFAEGVSGRFELVGVLDGAQVVGAQRVVGAARVGEVNGPGGAIQSLEYEKDLERNELGGRVAGWLACGPSSRLTAGRPL